MTQREGMLSEVYLPMDPTDLDESPGERWIRAILLMGFIAVLALEVWLVWQVWKLYS